MAIVALRGAINGEHAGNVATEAITAMLIFVFVGYVAGRIADYLVAESLEQQFRARVDWYRKGLSEAGLDSSATPATKAGKQNADAGKSA